MTTDDAVLGGRLPLLPPDRLAPAQRALYERLVGGRLGSASPLFRSRTDDGALIGPFNACLHAPDLGAAFLAMHEAEERATPLPRRVREVVILTVGAVWAADYELYAHRALSEAAGLAPADVATLAEGTPAEGLDAAEQAAQRFTYELTKDRRVSDATYRAAEDALGREGVVAATFLAGLYGLTCALLNAFAVPAPVANV